jgi:proteic killer suppression protein
MIQSLRDSETESVFNGRQTKAALKTCPVDLWKTVQRKFDQLDSVVMLDELRIPPGNRLEALPATGWVNTASGSTASTEYASYGLHQARP